MIAPVVTPSRTDLEQNRRRFFFVRIACWTTALVLGALQAWTTRFSMNPDGISYLDIGDAYWRHDWHNAINAYWSPMYSWILGFFINTIRPSPYWEYPLVHLVNLLIYIGALGCFEYFLFTLVFSRASDSDTHVTESHTRVPIFFLWVIGYSVFITSSLCLNGIYLVTPDLCVAAFVYLASALLLTIYFGTATRRTYYLLGVVLGIAYLAKAVMFPLGFVFLFSASLRGARTLISFRNSVRALLCFLLVLSPFIVALSKVQDHLTFSEVGRVAYEVYVDGAHQFIPDDSGLKHPVRKILDSPLIYEFASPINGTYALWYDSAYWHQGLRPSWSVKGEKQTAAYGMAVYLYITFIPFGVVLVSLIALWLVAPSMPLSLRGEPKLWPVTIPAFCALFVYLIVYTESRYVAPFYCVLWLLAFCRLRVNCSPMWTALLAFDAVIVLAASILFTWTLVGHNCPQSCKTPIYSEAAEGLSKAGIRAGDEIFVFGPNAFGEGGAFVARLARVRIVSESPDKDSSWMSNPEKCSEVRRLLNGNHVKGILLLGSPPPTSTISWSQLGKTNYYVHTEL